MYAEVRDVHPIIIIIMMMGSSNSLVYPERSIIATTPSPVRNFGSSYPHGHVVYSEIMRSRFTQDPSNVGPQIQTYVTTKNATSLACFSHVLIINYTWSSSLN